MSKEINWADLGPTAFAEESAKFRAEITRPQRMPPKLLSDTAKRFNTRQLGAQQYHSFSEAMAKGADNVDEWIADFEAAKAKKGAN